MLKVHPRAPFAPAGSGSKLFTFEDGDRRVYVERDLGRELRIAGDTVDAIDAIDAFALSWDQASGRPTASRTRSPSRSGSTTIRSASGSRSRSGAGPPSSRCSPRRRSSSSGRAHGFASTARSTSPGSSSPSARCSKRRGSRSGTSAPATASSWSSPRRRSRSSGRSRWPRASRRRASRRAPSPGGAPRATHIHDAFGALLAQASELFESVERNRPRRVPAPLRAARLYGARSRGSRMARCATTSATACVDAGARELGAGLRPRRRHGPRQDRPGDSRVLLDAREAWPGARLAPTSVSSNWIAELARFAPSLRVSLATTRPDRAACSRSSASGDVLSSRYGLLARERERSPTRASRRSSSTRRRREERRRTQRARRRRAASTRDFTIALSGTPLENHLGELWSLVDRVPGLARRARPVPRALPPCRSSAATTPSARGAGALLAAVPAAPDQARGRARAARRATEIDRVPSSCPDERARYDDAPPRRDTQLAKRRARRDAPRSSGSSCSRRSRGCASSPATPKLFDATSTVASSKIARVVELARRAARRGPPRAGVQPVHPSSQSGPA